MNPLLHWLTTPEWAHVVKALLHSLWQGALVVLSLALLLRRIVNPETRYRVMLSALATLVLTSVMTWGFLTAPQSATPAISQPAPALTAISPITPIGPVDKIAVPANWTPAQPQVQWTAWLALVWLLGSAAMLGRASVKVAGAEQLRRACQPLNDSRITELVAEARRAVKLTRRVRVAVTNQLTSPAVVGVLVPTLILPLSLITTLSPEQLRFVLLHELAHIRRGDYLANLFQLFAEALFFFNPAVWWLSHQIRREREACCDALAIELSGAPADYARTLVSVAETILNPPPAAAPAFGNSREPSSLSDRVQRALVPGYRPSLRLTWRAMLAALVAGLILLGALAVGTRETVAATAALVAAEREPATAAESANSTTETNAARAYRMVQNGKLLFESGKTNDAKTLFISALELDADNVAAKYYLDVLEKEEQQAPSPAPRPHLLSRQQILNELKNIRLESVAYDHLPLSEVVRTLADETKRRDPDHEINFYVFPGKTPPPLADFIGGWHLGPAVSFDGALGAESITIKPALKDITLDGVLDAIVRASPTPIVYAVEDYGIVIKLDQPNAITLPARTFILASNELARILGVPETMPITNVLMTFKDFFDRNGVDIKGPGRSYFYTLGQQRLFVRATEEDLDKIGLKLQRLRAPAMAAANPPSEGSPKATNKVFDSNAPPVLGRLFRSDGEVSTVLVDESSTNHQTAPLYTRTFQISSNDMARALGNVGPASSTKSNLSVREFIAGGGVDLSVPGKAAFYHDRRGDLFVRATLEDLDQIENFIKSCKVANPSSTAAADPPINITNLVTRMFSVDPNGLVQAMKASRIPESTNHTEQLRQLFASLGVDLQPPKALFFNERQGGVFVRATSADLDIIEQAVQVLNQVTPQVNIRAKFVEVQGNEDQNSLLLGSVSIPPANGPSAVQPKNSASPSSTNSSTFTGILTPAQFKVVLQALEKRNGIEILSTPDVTTISGRPAQLQVVDMRTIVSGLSTITASNGVSTNVFQTSTMPFGPVLDVTPSVSPDGYTVTMVLSPTVTEFVGYQKPDPALAKFARERAINAELPLPIYRERRATTSATVWDGQTIVIGGFTSEIVTRQTDGIKEGRIFRKTDPKAQKKQLFVFITPTIIDPAGNRVHTDDQLSMRQAPPQPKPVFPGIPR